MEGLVSAKRTTLCGVNKLACRKCSTFRRLAGNEPIPQTSGYTRWSEPPSKRYGPSSGPTNDCPEPFTLPPGRGPNAATTGLPASILLLTAGDTRACSVLDQPLGGGDCDALELDDRDRRAHPGHEPGCPVDGSPGGRSAQLANSPARSPAPARDVRTLQHYRENRAEVEAVPRWVSP